MTIARPSYWIISMIVIFHALHTVRSQAGPNLTSIGCVGRRCYYLVPERVTWSEARDLCQEHNETYLATVPDNETREFLNVRVRPRPDGAWLGGREVLFGKWRWLTNEIYYGEMHEYNNKKNKPFCGVVNPVNWEYLEGSPCTELKRYLCATSDANLNPDNYYISPEKTGVTWFQAREQCLSRGMDLISIKGNYTNLLYQLLAGRTNNFWIGLTKSRYIWENDGRDLKYTYFKTGEPNYNDELCLEITKVGEYNDEHCEMERPFICEWVNTTMPPETTFTYSTGENQAFIKSVGLVIGATVGGGLIVIISIAICVWLIARRSKRNRERRRQSRTDAYGYPDDTYGYNNSICKNPDEPPELVYDVTSQFHFISRGPIQLANKDEPCTTKQKGLTNPKPIKKKKPQRKGVKSEIFENTYVNTENTSQENLYQNSQAALPHYQHMGSM